MVVKTTLISYYLNFANILNGFLVNFVKLNGYLMFSK